MKRADMSMEFPYYKWDKETDQIEKVGISDLDFSHDARRVALDKVAGSTHTHVSTVFLAIDHSFSRSGSPVLFESMLFFCGIGSTMQRYKTASDARYGHAVLVEHMKEEVLPVVCRLRSARRIKKWLSKHPEKAFLSLDEVNRIRCNIPSLTHALKNNTPVLQP